MKDKILIAMFLLLYFGVSMAQTVRFETTVGVIDVALFPDDAPVTVQNFLTYVNRGDYDGTVIHRSEPGFVIQGGGYSYQGNNNFTTLASDAPIVLEANRSNTLGTIAMARTNDPNSATTQWFFNLKDNASTLDANGDNPGYAVFGQITKGLDVVKLIESFFRVNFSSSNIGQAASRFPIYGFFSGSAVSLENAVKINRAYVLSDVFQINAGLSGAWFNPNTTGQGLYIEVLPAADTLIMAWFAFDTADPDAGVMNQVGYAGSRWLTAAGPYAANQFNGSLFKTTGGIFDDPATVENVQVGSVSITFNSCSEATFNYTINESNLNGNINLQRVSGANVDLCNELASAANTGLSND